jgi:VanZ family protein
MKDRALRWLLILVLLIIALATLMPVGGNPPRSFPRFEPADILINLCLYLPLGLLLAARATSVPGIAILSVVLSATIELLQTGVIPGRRGSLVDVAANLAGAMLGLGLYRAAGRIRRSRSKLTRAAAAGIVGLPGVLWIISGSLLAPSPPSSPEWWGQWAHRFPETEPFRGTILAVSFLGHPVPDSRLDSTATLRAEAGRVAELTLEVSLLAGGSAEGPTHLAGIADGKGASVIRLDQLGEDLSLSWRSRGASLGLRAPRLVFPGVLSQSRGERVTIHASVTRSRGTASIRSETGLREEAQRLSALTGWRSLIPTRGLSHDAQRAFDVVWTAILLGYLLLAARMLQVLRLSY